MLGAYFDDSGTHDDSAMSVGAGYVGSRDEWDALAAEWTALLAGAGVRVFHAAPCANGGSEFRGMPPADRDQLRRELIGAINRRQVVGIGSVVAMEAYHRVVDAELRNGALNPYLLNIQNVVMQLCEFATTEYPGEQIELFVERRRGFDSHVLAAFNALKDMGCRPSLHTLVLQDKDEIGLQCADLLAYETHVEMTRRLEGQRSRQPRRSFLALLRNRLEGNYFDSANVLGLLLEHIQQAAQKDDANERQ